MIHLIWKTAKSFDLYSPSKNTVPDPADLSLCESTAGRYKIENGKNVFILSWTTEVTEVEDRKIEILFFVLFLYIMFIYC